MAAKKVETNKRYSRSPKKGDNGRDAPAPKNTDATRHKVHKSLCQLTIIKKDKAGRNKITMADLDVSGGKATNLPDGLTETQRNYLTMPGSQLIDGKIIMKDGFNMTDASLDEKMDYMDKCFNKISGMAAAIWVG